MRFAGEPGLGGDLRPRIWRDTLALVSDSRWCGAGLGNSQALFSFFRAESLTQSAVIHPESDWLLIVAEIGWPRAALALVAIGIVLAGALPLERNSQWRLRSAAAAAAVAAVIHGFVDVPGHRLGSVFVATYALVLARRDPIGRGVSRLAPGAWRAAGLAIVTCAAWWMNVPDDTARAEVLAGSGRFDEAAVRATRAIQRE